MAARERVRTHVNVAFAIAAAVVLTVVVNYLGAKYYTQWDFTEAGLHSLSDRTVTIVRDLDRDVRLVSFLGLGASPLGPDALEQIESVLETYGATNPARVTVEKIDVLRDSLRAEALLRELDIDPFRDGTDVVVVEAGERRRQVRLEELVEFDPSAGMGGPPPVRAITAESALTSAILSVSRDRQPVVAFATGHGERSMRGPDPFDLGRFVEALEREDTEVVSWDSRAGSPLPEGLDALVIASPTEPWLERERQVLTAFLDRGGRVLLFLDPVPQRAGGGALVSSGLEGLLAERGIVPNSDIVLDPVATYRGNMAEFVGEVHGGHTATTGLSGLGVLFTVTRSIGTVEPGPGSVTARVETILESSAESWGESDLASLFRGVADQGEADAPGPLPLIVLSRSSPAASGERAGGERADEPATGTDAGGVAETRLIVAGDVDLAANDAFGNPGNRGLALNLVSFLLEEERSLGIPPKDRTLSRLFLPREQLVWLFPVITLLLPLAAVIAAISLWLRRRRD
jgi:hypothetical protein